MRSIASICAVCVAALALSGCAFSVYDTPLNYSYNGTVAPPQRAVSAVRVADVHDARDVPNKRMILNQTNGYGQTTTGGWQAEKELALVVQDALTAAAQRLHPSVAGEAPFIVLESELINVGNRAIVGWTRGTFTILIQVRFTLRNERTGQVIYRDTITGEGSSTGAGTDNIIRAAFNNALTNLVDKTFTDDYFLQQLSSVSAGSTAVPPVR